MSPFVIPWLGKLLLIGLLGLGLVSCAAPGPVDNFGVPVTSTAGYFVPPSPFPSATLITSPLTPTPSLTPLLLTETATASPAATATWPPATPTALACWRQGGQMVIDSLDSELLPKPLEYRVYLPPCYQEQPRRRYPVLYLIHGQSYTDDQWDRMGADETADRLIAAGETAPFIIVMPRDRVWSQPTEDMFGQAVVRELIPYMDHSYRTLTARASRAVGGLSRGAGWAVHLGITHWDLFGALGGHSLPVFHTDTIHMRAWLDEIPDESLPRIYIDIGDKDRPEIMRSALWFEALLEEKSIPHEWYLFSGYHEEAYWMAHMEQYLRWYAREW